MGKSLLVLLAAAVLTACSTAPERVQQNTNSAAEPQRSEKLQSAIAHTTENQPGPAGQNSDLSAAKSKWTQGGTPIDTREFDAAIAKAEKELKPKPADLTAKKTLADAYFRRGVALTEARQYASALGDYRRVLNFDPSNEDAQKWIDQIIMIYNSMNKEYPMPGEEPSPLPYKADKPSAN